MDLIEDEWLLTRVCFRKTHRATADFARSRAERRNRKQRSKDRLFWPRSILSPFLGRPGQPLHQHQELPDRPNKDGRAGAQVRHAEGGPMGTPEGRLKSACFYLSLLLICNSPTTSSHLDLSWFWRTLCTRSLEQFRWRKEDSLPTSWHRSGYSSLWVSSRSHKT